MQDGSNLRQPPKNTSAKGKCVYSNLFNNLSSVSSTAFGIQQFIKFFTATSDEMNWHAVLIHTD
jgi:hypothetical protein